MGTGAVVAVLLLLAGCSGSARNDAGNQADTGNAEANVATTVEDVSPDSLVAPDNMVLGGDEGATANSGVEIANSD
jgi:hypothetical protein